MKKVLLGLSLIIFAIGGTTVRAQNILEAEDENNLSNFYTRVMSSTRKAIPYPHLRQSDVIWETCIWRTSTSARSSTSFSISQKVRTP